MVRIITQNVKGLKNKLKRCSVFAHLRKKADIICIQETHSESHLEKEWQLDFGGYIYWSHGCNDARGVAILVKKNLDIEILGSVKDNEGRVIGINYQEKGEKFSLLNIYAPNEDEPKFFVQTLKMIESFEGKRIILGDFNTTLNVDIDRSSSKSANNDKCTEILNKYIEDTLCTDIWRERNPDEKRYTYCRMNPKFIGSRLDFVLIDASINAWVPLIEIKPGFKSDHSAVICEINPFEIVRGRGLWKMNNQVLFEIEYIREIDEIIERRKKLKIQSKREFWEMLKLEIISTTQTYCIEKAGERRLVFSQLEDMIENYEKNLESLQENELKMYQKTKLDFQQLVDDKTNAAIFRSGMKYFTEGEMPTRFFYNMEKNKAGAKSMACLKKENGEITYNTKEILSEQKKFFAKLYKSDENVKFDYINTDMIELSEEVKTSLDGEIQMHEATSAIKNMKRNVSPGADGLTTEFYMCFWNKLKQTILDAINESYREGALFESALRGILTLIPKRNRDPRELKNVRPISLLATDYKIIEKVLAMRMKVALDEIISQDQKGFMASRRINCNIRRVLDLVEFADRENQEGLIISVDFMKCFDMIEIEALKAALRYFNFGELFIKWVDIIYTGSIACVANNGYFSEYYPVTRLVKQGGPCSAFFFLVLAEIVAIELRKNPKLEGFLVKEVKRILGQYADDMDLYLKADKTAIKQAFDTLEKFITSGFRINYDKTSIYRIGSIKKSNAKMYTDNNVLWPRDGINILGVEVTHETNKLVAKNYKDTIKKAQGILSLWSSRSLSLIGKVLIVNTLIVSLFVYKMTVLPNITQDVLRQMNKMIESFIWNNRKPKIPLSVLQASKENGGLGLVNLLYKDKALKASWVTFYKTDELCNAMLKYFLKITITDELWQCNLSVKDVKLLFDDCFWRDVLAAWCELHFVSLEESCVNSQIIWYNTHIRIDNKPIFWEKCYCEGLIYLNQLFDTDGKLWPHKVIQEMFGLSQMQTNQLLTSIPTSWKKALTQNSQSKEDPIYNEIITSSKPVAKLYKKLNSSTSHLHNAYQKWQQHTEITIDFDDYCQLFCNVYTITNNAKLRSFQFRILHSAIVLNRHLYRWRIKKSPNCSICETKETMIHLFWECPQTVKLWADVKKYCSEYAPLEICNINKENIFTNLVNPAAGHVFNFICLVVKQQIYAAKCLKTPINIFSTTQHIEKLKRFELYKAKQNGRILTHMKKWLLDDVNGTGLDMEILNVYQNI